MNKKYAYKKYENIIFKDFTDGTSSIFDDYMRFFDKKDILALGSGIFTIIELKLKFSLETSTTVGVDSYVKYLNLITFEEKIIEREFECLISRFDENNYVKILNDESGLNKDRLTELEDVIDEHYSEEILKFDGEYFEKYHDLLPQNIKTKKGQLITGAPLEKLKKAKMKFTHEDVKNLVNYSLRKFKSSDKKTISDIHFCKRIDGKVFITDNGSLPNSIRVGHYLVRYMSRDVKKIDLYEIIYKGCNQNI